MFTRSSLRLDRAGSLSVLGLIDRRSFIKSHEYESFSRPIGFESHEIE